MSRPRPTNWQRDFRRLRALAIQVVEQCGHFERNTAHGSDDTIRAVLIEQRTREMDRIGRRLEKRYQRSRKAQRSEFPA